MPEATRWEVMAFLESQQVFTVADLASTTAQDLSLAFPKVSSEFTLGHRSAVRFLLSMAQEMSPNADVLSSDIQSGRRALMSRAGDRTKHGGERMLSGKQCM